MYLTSIWWRLRLQWKNKTSHPCLTEKSPLRIRINYRQFVLAVTSTVSRDKTTDGFSERVVYDIAVYDKRTPTAVVVSFGLVYTFKSPTDMASNRTSVGDRNRFNGGVNKNGQRQATAKHLYTYSIYNKCLFKDALCFYVP